MSNTKMDKAVNRARGTEIPSSPETEALAAISDVSDEIGTFDPKVFVAATREQGYVAAAKFLEMQPGQMFSGYLIGREVVQVDDPNGQLDIATGKMRQNDVERLTFELGSGAIISILSSAQLDTAFKNVVADGSAHCIIGKGDKTQTSKKRMMDNYHVVIKRAARAVAPQLAAPAVQVLAGLEQ